VLSDGLWLGAGFNVRGGFQQQASDGFSINNGGLLVATGGITIYGLINLQSSPTVYSDERLKTNITTIDGALDKLRKLRGVYFYWKDPDSFSEGLLDRLDGETAEFSGLLNITNSSRSEMYGKSDISIGTDSISVNRVELNASKQSINNSSSKLKSEWSRRQVGVIAQNVRDTVPEAVYSMENGKYLGVQYESLVPLLVEGLNSIKRRVFSSRCQGLVKSKCEEIQVSDLYSRIRKAEEDQKDLLLLLDKLQQIEGHQKSM
jgi:hypothetical protein